MKIIIFLLSFSLLTSKVIRKKQNHKKKRKLGDFFVSTSWTANEQRWNQ